MTHAAVAGSRAASLVVCGVGLIVLSGWIFDLQPLTQLLWTGPNVKTNTALALACGALSNYLLISAAPRSVWRHVGRGLAVIPLALGGLTLSEHLTGWNLGIDQFLAAEPAGAFATMSPNRMGPPASSAFLLLGIALLLADRHHRGARVASQACAAATVTIAILPLTGYAYGFSPLYAVARYTGIALTTALALLLLSLAVLAGRPDRGLVGLLCRDDEMGTLTRTLVPPAILLPFGAGWLLARAIHAGAVDGAFAVSAMAVVLVLGLTGLIWRTGTQLARALDERVATQQALRESERSLREADRQKTEFLATLSHELRNPLAPIRFALDLLNGPAATAERARKIIARQVDHLVRLIDDLLDLTRITRNKLQLQVRDVELRQVVSDAVDAVASELSEAQHRLDLLLPEVDVQLRADPDRMVQVLVNLLTNAVRYTPSGGVISLTATVDAAHVVFRVCDSGAGLARQDLDRVFDMFVQVGEGAHAGLGIGLALVRGLVELHGGTVEARSEGLGLGAEFLVRIPAARVAPTAHPLVAAARPHVEPRRILVVDDNKDAADMLRDVLVARGHRVQVAYNGADALDLAMSFRPQVALLDIGMSGMNGHELAGRLRREPLTADMVLIAVTGWGQEDDQRRAIAAGFDAHLTKPADAEAIIRLIAERTAPALGVTTGGTRHDRLTSR